MTRFWVPASQSACPSVVIAWSGRRSAKIYFFVQHFLTQLTWLPCSTLALPLICPYPSLAPASQSPGSVRGVSSLCLSSWDPAPPCSVSSIPHKEQLHRARRHVGSQPDPAGGPGRRWRRRVWPGRRAALAAQGGRPRPGPEQEGQEVLKEMYDHFAQPTSFHLAMPLTRRSARSGRGNAAVHLPQVKTPPSLTRVLALPPGPFPHFWSSTTQVRLK